MCSEFSYWVVPVSSIRARPLYHGWQSVRHWYRSDSGVCIAAEDLLLLLDPGGLKHEPFEQDLAHFVKRLNRLPVVLHGSHTQVTIPNGTRTLPIGKHTLG